MPSINRQRIALLRQQMQRAAVSAYYIPLTDPHQSEIVPACWQRLRWLTGFTGSSAEVAVTKDAAALWTDGRYHLQAEGELRGSGIRVLRGGQPGTPSLAEWLAKRLRPSEIIGLDPKIVSLDTAARLMKAMQPHRTRIRALERNLVDAIWDDRAALPKTPISHHPARYAGVSMTRKVHDIRRAMAAVGAQAHVLTALDGIAWLFNLRASDIPFAPLAIAAAIIERRRITLFCAAHQLDSQLTRAFKGTVEVRPYEAFGRALSTLRSRVGKHPIWIDSVTASLWLKRRLRGGELVCSPSAIWRLKARKNLAEIEGAKRAHLRDGVALARCLAWLNEMLARGKPVTERSLAAQLVAFRAADSHYRGESFEAIVGYAAHGAIVHYAATLESDARLKRNGLLLVDSGGQYVDGTTDVTRTILLSRRATKEQREVYTRVLKGHIALARARFPPGTAGHQLDTLARQPLWQIGANYAHGTGHGVGSYLCVHEGPQSISNRARGHIPLEPGNILSNEPGFYREGAYGIRIENLLLVAEDPALKRAGRPGLRFEVLTLCPIERRLVDASLLSPSECEWVNRYHRHVRQVLWRHLSGREQAWLRGATEPL